MDKLQFVYVSDRVDVVRCKDCKHCYSLTETDPMTPYDGSGDGSFYCEAFDMEFYAPRYRAGEYYCAEGERRENTSHA